MKHIVACLMVVSLTSSALGDELQDLRDQVAALRAENQQLKEQLAQLTGENEELVQQTAELTEQTEQLTELAGMTARGDRVESQSALFETIYRPDSDSTLVRSKPDKMTMTAGSSQDHYITLVFTHPGREPDGQTRPVRWYIQTQSTPGDYRRIDAMTLALDDKERIDLPMLDYNSRMRGASVAGRKSSQRGSETLLFELDPDTAHRLGAATSVTGELGITEFKLSPDQIATFRAMLKRQSLRPPMNADERGSE